MSLINQMLYDLDKRRTRRTSSPGYIIAGLHSPRAVMNAIADKQRFSTATTMLLGLLGILLVAVVWRLITVTAPVNIPPHVGVNMVTPVVTEQEPVAVLGTTGNAEPLIEDGQIDRFVDHARQIRATTLYSSEQLSTPVTQELRTPSTIARIQTSKLETNIADPSIQTDVHQRPAPAPVQKVPVHEKQRTVLSKITAKVTAKPAAQAVVSRPVIHQSSRPRANAIEHVNQQQNNTTLKKKFRPATDEQLAESAYVTGLADIRKGSSSQGMDQLRIALSHDPKHIKAREILAGLLIKAGQNTEAAMLLRKGIELNPGHSQYAKLYSRILLEEGDTQAALNVLEANKPSFNADPEYYAMLAAVYQKADQFQQAADIYSQLVTLQPRSGIFWMGLGISLEGYGQSKEALDAYQYAIKNGGLKPDLVNYISSRISAIKNKTG